VVDRTHATRARRKANEIENMVREAIVTKVTDDEITEN